MFELKKHRGVMFMALKIDAEFEGKLTCGFKNEVQQIFTDWKIGI